MSLALARKYRPKTFAAVAGQSHASNTLRGAIARGKVAHGYLLSGPRGVGKTTLARVLAMALNCENKRDDGEPCGTCVSCQRIWSGSSRLGGGGSARCTRHPATTATRSTSSTKPTC